MNKKYFSILFLLLVIFSSLGYSQTDPVSYPKIDFTGQVIHKVVDIVDGNTVKIEFNGSSETVQLVGVDTPETVHPTKPVEEFGKEASNFTKNLLSGESVYFIKDDLSDTVDKYGRLLGYIYRYPDGLFVNLEIVRQGYGHAYTQFPFSYTELFSAYEKRAREAGKGLWGSSPTLPNNTTPATTERVIEAPRKEQTQEVTVYITKTGSKYHRGGCRYLSKSMIPISLKDAKLRYSACSVCNPPR